MSSIKLLTVRGIPIRMHITFPLILILAAFQFAVGQSNWLQGALFGVVATLLLFVGVVLHELAHSVVAMAFGTEVEDIVLLPLGGVAQMKRMPEKPYQELLMAIAGPAMSALIGITLGLLTLLLIPLGTLVEFARSMATGGLRWAYLLPYLTVVNLFLAGFNLLPAFPMDGGRVLRAMLATIMPFSRATAIAISVGQGLAWLLGLIGLMGRNVPMILVAVFVYVGAAQEERIARIKTALAGLRVGQSFSRQARTVSPDATLEQAVDLTLAGFQSDFPVCDGQKLVGMLTRIDLLVGLKEKGPQTLVSEAMRREFLVAQPTDDLFDVHQRMVEAGIEAVPVVEKGIFCGVLTRQDLEEVYGLVTASPGLLPRQVQAATAGPQVVSGEAEEGAVRACTG